MSYPTTGRPKGPQIRTQLTIAIWAAIIFSASSVLGSPPVNKLSIASASTPSIAGAIEPGNVGKLSKLVQLPQTGFSPTWSPDGKKLAIVGYQEVLIYNVAALNQEPVIFSAGPLVDSVIFSPDGTMLAAGNLSAVNEESSRVFAWDLHTGAQKVILERVYNPVFSLKGNFLVATDVDYRDLVVWNMSTNKLQFTLRGLRDPVFSPRGSLLALGGIEAYANPSELWDIATARHVANLKGDSETTYLKSMAFSPDGEVLASGAGDGSLKLWDMKTLKAIPTIRTTCAEYVQFGRDDSTLLTWSPDCSENETIQIWDVALNRKLVALEDRAVRAVTFSPVGTLVAVDDTDQTRFLDAKTGKELLVLQSATEPEFSPDGSLLVA